jgi:hypothetical protein
MYAIVTVIFGARNSVRLSKLFIFIFCKCSINPITNPNPVYSHSIAWYLVSHHTPAPAIGRRGRTCEKSSHRTRAIGTQDYPSSSLLTGHPLTALRASLVFGRELRPPCDLLFGAPSTWNDPQSITRQIVWTIYTRSTVMPANTWSWPVTGWKLVTTDWSTARATMRATECGSIAQPTQRGNIAQAAVIIGSPVQGSHADKHVVYRKHRKPRSWMMMVHLDRVATYQGIARNERP